mgnify:CR=1 FL=1
MQSLSSNSFGSSSLSSSLNLKSRFANGSSSNIRSESLTNALAKAVLCCVYVRHEIVHNKHVVDGLKKIGAIFVEEIDEIEDKTRPVVFSAHGVPKSVPQEAKSLAPGIAEALFATALGLLAAIPAVIAYNIFTSQVNDENARMYRFKEHFNVIFSRGLSAK